MTEALAAAGEGVEGADETRGESLLLPLLQGLLGGGGERLLAGLGAAGADVVADVRRSLARLRAALAPPTDHPQARALLTLADRLEDALDAADRLDGCRARKPRRRNRAARHTVGVTHEELAEARRMVDRGQLLDAEPLSQSSGPASTTSGANSVEDPATPERKQSIDEGVSYHDAIASRHKPAPIQHSASFVDTPRVNRDARVVERRAPAPKRPDFFRHSIADGLQAQQALQQPELQQMQQQEMQQPQQMQQPQEMQQPQQMQQPYQTQQQQQIQQPQQMYQPQQNQQIPQQQQPQQPLQPQQPYQMQQPFQQPHLHKPYQSPTRRSSDAKSGIAAIANKFDSQAQERAPEFPRRVPQRRRSPPTVTAPTFTQKPIREEAKRVPLYKPLPPTYNFAAPPPAEEFSKPLNRFSNNKRSRMKRANTIDIGRPLAGYKLDSDTDDDLPRGPAVPKFQPQTENDRKFVAFMRKNEESQQVTVNGQANWSNRFGNIKNTFETREQDDSHSRSSSSSSARRFWRAADESPPPAPRPRKFLADVTNTNIVKPPWTMEKREPRAHAAPRVHIPPPAPLPPQNLPPPIPQSPTRPVVVKPFVAKPIPVNQFSHAPMSAFKPPTKITSPTNAPSLVWSPPSVLHHAMSPTTEQPPPPYVSAIKPIITSPPVQTVPWTTPATENPRRIVNNVSKFESPPPPPLAPVAPPAYRERYVPNPPTPPTHAPPQIQSYPVKSIPSQNNLAAPELVRKIDDTKPYVGSVPFVPKDVQKLQIEFYEKQIRERARHEPITNGHSEPAEQKPPAPLAYTVTDYTPTNVISTFVPLQQTPDIEKARAHKVDYLPDVVMNEGDRNEFTRSPIAQPHQQNAYQIRSSPHMNNKPTANQNGESIHDDGPTTEHGSVETRVMRGPVRGAATITAGVRTRNDDTRRGGAADNLKGVLDKISSPKRDVIAQIERKKRETARSQVRIPVQNGISPLPAHASPNPRPPAIEYESPHSPGIRSPALAASRESVSSESAGSFGSSPLSRSGSWHQIADRSPKSTSPRKVVARAKSMHLLAVPKMFEGGIARDELTEKKRSVEAYFSGQTASASRSHAAAVRARASRSTTQAYSLGRSRTMPTVSELQFLDESNADDAFEDLVSALA